MNRDLAIGFIAGLVIAFMMSAYLFWIVRPDLDADRNGIINIYDVMELERMMDEAAERLPAGNPTTPP
jgi:hypothetical protein